MRGGEASGCCTEQINNEQRVSITLITLHNLVASQMKRQLQLSVARAILHLLQGAATCPREHRGGFHHLIVCISRARAAPSPLLRCQLPLFRSRQVALCSASSRKNGCSRRAVGVEWMRGRFYMPSKPSHPPFSLPSLRMRKNGSFRVFSAIAKKSHQKKSE